MMKFLYRGKIISQKYFSPMFTKKESKGDLFIYSEFENARRYSERIKELGLFNDVVFVNHRKIGSSFKRKINLLTNHNQFFSDKKYKKNSQNR
ncbi:hypothetical protein [Enterococcus faecium]|uniref:hypothetical protein n=1 Tax=Enterococcus faecium TaxID=1352 RepID=UPI0038B3CF22